MQISAGILGGTFNPIHFGHLRIAEEVREKIALKKVLFIPSGNPPLKFTNLAPAPDRYEMVRLAIEGNPCFSISDIECSRPGKSYTVETIRLLKERAPDHLFHLILGTDAFLDIPTWHEPEELMGSVHFVVVSRPGHLFSSLAPWVTADAGSLTDLDMRRRTVIKTHLTSGKNCYLLNVTPLDISATAIRRLIRNNRSTKYLLPAVVESYIISRKLYREGSEHL